MIKILQLAFFFPRLTTQYTKGGKVLGNRKSFREYYAKPIEAARERTASRGIIEHGQRKSKELQTLLKPYFLQRLKIDYLKGTKPKESNSIDETSSPKNRSVY
jgi:SNF2 family DNA or RNA helicase